MPTVTLTLEQIRAANLTRAHVAHLVAAGARTREHFDVLDGVPVGLARKALRYRRARRRAERLSGKRQSFSPSLVYIKRETDLGRYAVQP